jgi:hypothetical protein
MSDVDRKARRREYKETPLPAGVFSVRNTVARKSLLGASPNAPGKLNSQRFQLEMGSHPDHELQADWNALGPDAFTLEVLDLLEMADDPAYDPTDDLLVLKELWLERLEAAGETFYRQTSRGTRG